MIHAQFGLNRQDEHPRFNQGYDKTIENYDWNMQNVKQRGRFLCPVSKTCQREVHFISVVCIVCWWNVSIMNLWIFRLTRLSWCIISSGRTFNDPDVENVFLHTGHWGRTLSFLVLIGRWYWWPYWITECLWVTFPLLLMRGGELGGSPFVVVFPPVPWSVGALEKVVKLLHSVTQRPALKCCVVWQRVREKASG